VALFLLVYPLVNQTPKQTEAAQINKQVVVTTKGTTAEPTKTVPSTERVAEPVTPTKTPEVSTPQPQPPATYHSDDFYKEFIFSHESSNRLDAVNPGGCYGLGQSCSNALRNACPNWSSDLNCQLAFWDSYALSRYGSWQGAYNHWIARVPINGKDVGNWW
jgi:hypothetical protein